MEVSDYEVAMSLVDEVAVWSIDLVNSAMGWSSSVYDLFSVTEGSYQPEIMSFSEFCHVQDRVLVEEFMNRLVTQYVDAVCEYRFAARNGVTGYLQLKTRCVRDEHDKPVKIIGVCQNLTQLRADARDYAKISAAHLSYIESSNDGFWDWYVQEEYEYMSPRFWEIFGYLPEEKEHSPAAWQDMIFKEDLEVALTNFNRHVETKGDHPYEQEVRYRHKDGSTVTVFCRGKMVEWGPNGEPLRMVGTHTDITPLKKIENELRDVNSELREFNSRASHDLRSPLRSSRQLIKLISSEIEQGNIESAMQSMNVACRSLENLEALVEDLLSLTKEKYWRETATQFSPERLVEQVLSKVSNMEGFDQISIVKSYSGKMFVTTQEETTRHVLENLLTNAIKYRDPNERSPQVTIEISTTERCLILAVSDNGLGISEAHHDQLFGMFKRFHAKFAYGSGLGLYLIKKSIEKIGGTIEFIALAKGSRFVATLPVST